MNLEGTIQLAVHLRTKSVEFSAEPIENRWGCVLKSDVMDAKEIVTKARLEPRAEGMEDRDILESVFGELTELVGMIGQLTSFHITQYGNIVQIRGDNISHIIVETTGIFREIQDASE